MMQRLWYSVTVVLLFACQDVQRPERPENLIPEDTMVSLLSEVYIGNAARSIDNKQIRKEGVRIDSFLFKKFNIDSVQFAKSNAYYAADLDAYMNIINQVQNRLDKLKKIENERRMAENAKERAARDSIGNSGQKEVRVDSATSEPGILTESANSDQEN
ncbi:MAG: DUF4296 domain-containing protein [Marinirhabdus sp.]|nr:DUF4296 domain-containing protein [Marinirhabdus sp.]